MVSWPFRLRSGVSEEATSDRRGRRSLDVPDLARFRLPELPTSAGSNDESRHRRQQIGNAN